MQVLGVLVAVGAGIVFIVVGLLTLAGGVVAVQREIIPGLKAVPGNPGRLLLGSLGNGLAFLLPALLSVYAGIEFLRLAF